MKKVVVLVLSFGLIGSAMGQIAYPTNVFWQFLEGLQAGDSSTLNYLEYKNDFLLLKTDQRDDKVLQVRNELNDIGITTIFIDANGNGGISVDSSNGNTVVKLRGAPSDHSYINNEFVSVGRGGQSQDYGGTVDGAKFTVSSDTREPDYGLWDANNYQMMLQSSKDSIGGYVGLAFTSESAAQDRNVGAFINYRKTGNNGRGELHFGTKTSTTSLDDGVNAMKIYDGYVTIDSTIVLPNLATGTSDTVLILDGDVVKQKDISSFADNIYNTDGTLTGDRTLDLDTYDLTFINGNVGIGTTNPTHRLQIGNGTATGSQYFRVFNSASDIYVGQSGGTIFGFSGNSAGFVVSDNASFPLGIGTTSAQPFVIGTNNVERLRITSAGNVGIGTSSPAYQLSLAGSANIQGVSGLNLLVGTRGIFFGLTGSTEVSTYLATSPLIFSLNQGSTAVARFAPTTGNFLINTTTDAGYKLQVNGTGYFADNLKLQTGIISFDGVSGYYGNAIKYEAGKFNLYQSGNLHLGVGGNNITLYKDTKILGNVGIGTTTPSAKIHTDNTATTGVGAIIENSNVTNTDDLIQFHNSTGEVASITNDGGAGFGNSSIDASAKVEITSTTKGFLPPRMTGTQAEAIATPAEGLMVYSTDGSGVTITSKGWWGYDGSTWVQLN